MNLNVRKDGIEGEALLLLTVPLIFFFIITSTSVLPLITGAGMETAGTVPVPPPGTFPPVGGRGWASHYRPLG